MTTSTPKKRSTRTRKVTPKAKPVVIELSEGTNLTKKAMTSESYPVTKEKDELNLLDLSILSFLYLEYFTKLLWKTSTKSTNLLLQ